MLRVVIDTNVFVSGIFWKGPPYQILQAWCQHRFKLIVSPPLLMEYERVLEELSAKYEANDTFHGEVSKSSAKRPEEKIV